MWLRLPRAYSAAANKLIDHVLLALIGGGTLIFAAMAAVAIAKG